MPGLTRTILISVATILCASLLACRSASQPPGQRYELKGKVVSVDKQQQKVTIAHEEIKGYMEAMTMPFFLKDAWALDVMEPGDQILATLVVSQGRTWLENPVITKSSGTDKNGGKTASALGPNLGDEAPDFMLVNQDGKRIRLHQYRGKALLLTFIYTRCPLPDYCPLMSQHFAAIERELQKNPALYDKTHLLSISVDPDYDKPSVLRKYGANLTGKTGVEMFKHWEFASGTAEEVKAVAQFFGLSYWTEKDQIIHSLVTTIIGPDGKIVKLYRGNEWKPAEALSDLEKLRLAEVASASAAPRYERH